MGGLQFHLGVDFGNVSELESHILSEPLNFTGHETDIDFALLERILSHFSSLSPPLTASNTPSVVLSPNLFCSLCGRYDGYDARSTESTTTLAT